MYGEAGTRKAEESRKRITLGAVRRRTGRDAKSLDTRQSVAKASEQAMRTGRAIDAKAVFVIPIQNLIGGDNPRQEPSSCYDKGYALFGDPDAETPSFDDEGRCVRYVSLLHLLTSDNLQKLEFGVKLVEETEGVDRDRHPDHDRTIPELAEDIAAYGQLVPVSVKQTSAGMVLSDGARRVSAVLLEHARSKAKAIREGATRNIVLPVVQASELDCDEEDLFVVSAKINLDRKGFTELQEGRVYHEMLKRVNPQTKFGGKLYDHRYPDGRNYTKKEASAELRVNYGTFRNREAMWHPYRETVNGRRGLTDEERRMVRRGQMGATYASKLSLGEIAFVSRNQASPVVRRHKALTLKEMEKLFDETPRSQTDRLAAIADCMRLDLDRAMADSVRRADEAMDLFERKNGIGRRTRQTVA